MLNAIELAWSKLKRTIHSENVFTEQLDKVMHLIKKVCDEISSDEWSKFVRHVVLNVEKKFRTRDHILDTEIEPLLIALADDDDSDVEYTKDCGIPNEY